MKTMMMTMGANMVPSDPFLLFDADTYPAVDTLWASSCSPLEPIEADNTRHVANCWLMFPPQILSRFPILFCLPDPFPLHSTALWRFNCVLGTPSCFSPCLMCFPLLPPPKKKGVILTGVFFSVEFWCDDMHYHGVYFFCFLLEEIGKTNRGFL